MKSDIHPAVYDVVYVDLSSGAQFIAQSTSKSDETMEIDGKTYYVMKVEISSDTHPFYTGKQTLVDTAGRVDKFRAKMEKAKKAQEEAAAKVKPADDEDEEEAEKEA